MSISDHLNHTPDAEGVAKAEQIRLKCIELEAVMEAFVPNSRELALAKTNLEQTRMWAIKGLVMQFPATPISPEALGNPAPAPQVPLNAAIHPAGLKNEDATNQEFMEKRRASGLHRGAILNQEAPAAESATTPDASFATPKDSSPEGGEVGESALPADVSNAEPSSSGEAPVKDGPVSKGIAPSSAKSPSANAETASNSEPVDETVDDLALGWDEE